jgi:thiamine-phosphate pyrophosphorylase
MAAQLFLIAPPSAEPRAFALALKALLTTTEVAALLVPRGDRPLEAFEACVRAAAPIAQAAGCAVLIEGDAAHAKALGVDGVHIEGPVPAIKAAIATLKPDMIVGVGGIATRHDAMTRGELNIDYIMFGPLSGATAPEMRELAGWWAETMEIPSVLSDPEAVGATANNEGCEFLALSTSIWQAPDPSNAVADIVRKLAGE